MKFGGFSFKKKEERARKNDEKPTTTTSILQQRFVPAFLAACPSRRTLVFPARCITVLAVPYPDVRYNISLPFLPNTDPLPRTSQTMASRRW